MKPTNVPTERVGPIIKQLIEERWPEWRRGVEEAGGNQILAEKLGCDEKAIRDIITQRWEGCGFDLVDSIFCALGRPDMLATGVLSDVYLAVDLLALDGAKHGTREAYEEHGCRCDKCLKWEPRACVRCGESFTSDRPLQRFCGAECQRLAHNRGRPKPEPRKCGWCNSEYTPKLRTSRYCSRSCIQSANYYLHGGKESTSERGRERRNHLPILERRCRYEPCGRLFTPPHRKGLAYCSGECKQSQKNLLKREFRKAAACS